MGLYQRRRPMPIKIYPNPARRQDSEAEEPDSAASTPGPDSASTLGPDSASTIAPDSVAPSTTTFPPTGAPSGLTAASTQVSSSSPAPAVTSGAVGSPSSLPPPAPTSTSSQGAEQTSLPTSSSSSSPETVSGPSTNTPAVTARPPTAPVAEVGGGSLSTDTPAPTTLATLTSSSQPTESSSGAAPSTTDTGPRSQLVGESSGIGRNPSHHRTLGKGAEAALVTTAVFGFVALLVGAYLLYKRRQRKRQGELRHAPDNDGGLSAPETVHIGFDPTSGHTTRSTTNSASLFGGSHYQRPDTVSTNSNSRAQTTSRIPPPQPTPNPFAEPGLNKAYDQLRGRPRSTTLTDRGSWVENPFRDPESDRFDPFGEMQERARLERIKYMQEVRQADMDRREKEREQQFLEKERMGLEVPEMARKRGR